LGQFRGILERTSKVRAPQDRRIQKKVRDDTRSRRFPGRPPVDYLNRIGKETKEKKGNRLSG